jgi:hypothetical protein
MNILKVLALLLALISAFSSIAAENIKAPSVDVPEKKVFQPTPEDIHQDAPPDQPCSSCHNPASLDAEYKWPSHFLTTKECDKCHLNKSWIPLRMYSHLSGKYRPNATPQECDSCHTSNSEFLAR